MSKPSNFTILADELREIRAQLVELHRRLDAPSHREQIQTRARDIEVPDPIPLEIPGGQRDQAESIQEIIARYVQIEHAKLQDDDLGTFEQEDDFTEDDFDHLPASLFEIEEHVDLEPDPEMPAADDASDLEDDPSTGHIPPAPAADPSVPEATDPTATATT